MSYYDSAEGIEITRSRALVELSRHGISDPSEFFAELGIRETYRAQDVLAWLGY